MAVFFGTHAMKIDGKGRVSMPAAFRDAMSTSGSTDAI
ncbi:MAG: division/cell wall cluster transcriptional repressor MraZ, partial [Alphaproteobacteria bacterium]